MPPFLFSRLIGPVNTHRTCSYAENQSDEHAAKQVSHGWPSMGRVKTYPCSQLSRE